MPFKFSLPSIIKNQVLIPLFAKADWGYTNRVFKAKAEKFFIVTSRELLAAIPSHRYKVITQQ